MLTTPTTAHDDIVTESDEIEVPVVQHEENNFDSMMILSQSPASNEEAINNYIEEPIDITHTNLHIDDNLNRGEPIDITHTNLHIDDNMNRGERLHCPPKIVSWTLVAVIAFPLAHDIITKYLEDCSPDFKSNHKILYGLSVLSLFVAIILGVLLSLVYVFTNPRPRAIIWFLWACFGCLMLFALLSMIVELILVLAAD